MTRPLNARQERFVTEYLLDQNAAAAAVRAGYSPNTKGTHAAELMRNPLVCQKIGVGLSAMFIKLGVTAENLLRQQARMAYIDPACLFDSEGRPIPLHKLSAEIRGVLTVSYDTRPDGSVITRVRLPNRQQALAALEKRYAQYLEMQMALLQAQAGEGGEVEEEGEAQEEIAEEAQVADVETGSAAPGVPDEREPEPALAVAVSGSQAQQSAPQAVPPRRFIDAAAQFLRGRREGEAAAPAWSDVAGRQEQARVTRIG